MTIEEAINHCEEKASGCSECAKEHAELAEWLKELIELRENQAKYEKALEMACDRIAVSADCNPMCEYYSDDLGVYGNRWDNPELLGGASNDH